MDMIEVQCLISIFILTNFYTFKINYFIGITTDMDSDSTGNCFIRSLLIKRNFVQNFSYDYSGVIKDLNLMTILNNFLVNQGSIVAKNYGNKSCSPC